MGSVGIIEGDIVIAVDAVLRESHRYASAVTQFPVESGATISDHVYSAPDTVSMDAVVSTHGLKRYDPDAVSRVFEALKLIRANRKPVALVTNLTRYPSMVMTSLSIDRDKGSGKAESKGVRANPELDTFFEQSLYDFQGASDSLRFTAEFSSILIVGTQAVNLPQPKPGRVAAQATPKAKAGQQSVQPVSAEEAKKVLKSALASSVDGLSDLIEKGASLIKSGFRP